MSTTAWDDADVESRGQAISLFSGAGGLDLGAHEAGFAVRAAVEYDRDAVATMEKNFDTLTSPVIQEDILDVTTEQILAAANMQPGEPDLLIGGPPCTPFSKSGFWLDWKRDGLDPDASLLQSYTKVLREAKPRMFILENVYALTFKNKASSDPFSRLLREITEAGYTAFPLVLNAADYGVPQARPRLFVMGVRDGLTLHPHPQPTHNGKWERRATGTADTRPHVTTGQALADVVAEPEQTEVVAGRYGHLLPEIPPGDNYLHYTEKCGHPDPQFEWRKRYWSFLLKLDPGRPSPTIQAQPGPYVGPFHWENRRLRVPELKRLFTFPDSFELTGSRNAIQSQLGNSVPPYLAYKVVKAILGEDDPDEIMGETTVFE